MNFWTSVDQWREYLSFGVLTGVLAALWRYLRPRRLLSFIAAVKERETAIAKAIYWEAEAGLEKQSGQRWKAHYDQALMNLTSCDAQNAELLRQLRACLHSNDGSGS